MTYLDIFNACTKGKFNTTKGEVDWRVEKKILCFQPSKGAIDWIKNFLFFPVPILWAGYFVIIPFGVFLDLHDLRKILKDYKDIEEVAGYSRGSWLAALSSMKLNVDFVTYGSPKLFYKPNKKVKEFLALHSVQIENPRDIVTSVPPGFSNGPNVVRLGGNYDPICDTIQEIIEAESGHSPREYRWRLARGEI